MDDAVRDYHQPCVIIDVDGTLCPTRPEGAKYADLPTYEEVVEKLRAYRRAGWYIIIHTARQERTYEGSIGLRMVNTVPVLIEWLDWNGVPYDELRIDKPWHGFNGFVVDDKTVPPRVFIEQTSDEILGLWLPSFAVK